MRILVTGSRDWADKDAIWSELAALAQADPFATLVHGACPTGADAIADDWWTGFGGDPERHPADWSRGRKAGPERNAAMVALGADLCLAFIGDCTSRRCRREDRHPSHGASGCADLAEAAGIETRRFYVPTSTETESEASA